MNWRKSNALSWEQRKLGDVFVEYSEKNHEELPALTIIQGGGTIRRDESDRSLLYDKANLSNYKMVKEGDFIVHLRSFEGGLEKATNTGIISPAYHTFHGENTDSRFYYSYFRSKKFIEIDLKPHVYGIRDGRSIDIEGMKTIKIPFTSYEEQKAIGTFTERLDHLITLHQSKAESWKNKKNLFLTIFWEQRKLGDIVDLRGRIGFRGYKRTDLVPEGSGAVTFSPADIDDDGHLSLINNTYISFEKYEESPEIKVKEGDILFTKTASIGKIAYVSKLREKSTINPQFALLTPNKSVDGYFLFLSLRTEDCLKYVRDISGGSSIPTMSQEKLKEMKIICPTLKEQQIIGEYYQKLDSLITLHQGKLERI